MRFLLTFIGAMLFMSESFAQQGADPKLIIIDADTTVEKDLVIRADEKLFIKPGVTLKFAEGTGIISEGVIEAKGTRDKLIVFTAKDSAKGWKNICLGGPAKEGSVLEYCKFSGGRGRVARFKQATLEFEKFPAPGDDEGVDVNCGGALFIYGPGKVEVRSCRFEGNVAYWGGAVNCWGEASPTITKCYFSGNKGEEDAGAIHCVARSNPTISENYFTSNSAKYGGAIHCLHGSSPLIQDNYISENRASGNSSAVSCFSKSSPTITGNYIAGNMVERDEGMAIETVLHSKPVLKGNYIGENKYKAGTGKGLRANTEFRDQKDESTCDEQEPATKENTLKTLRAKGVLDLAPAQK